MQSTPAADDARTMRERMLVGDDVWLGGGAIVLPGVTTGADTVAGAGSVLTRDLPAGVVAVGDPARVARTLART
jgi:maltose O-acetyltransferase